MKIGFVLLDGEITGGQLVILELMAAARAAGHEVAAFAPREGPIVDRLRREACETHVVPLERSYRADQGATLARLLRQARVDLVDAHTLFVGSQLARLAARLARIPIVAHAHIDERFHGNRLVAFGQRRLDAWTSRHCRAIIAVSRHLQDHLVSRGVPPQRIVVIHNGVRLGPFSAAPLRPGLHLLCVARLAGVKGQATLLEALALRKDGITVDFAGQDLEQGGAYQAELERLASRLAVADRVRFLGQRADVERLLDEADALVLPSLSEGLPLVVLEAMACARAVVATAVGGTPEAVVHRQTGLLVEPGSASGLADALGQLRADAGLRRRLGLAGRERAARLFRAERMAARTLAVLEAAALGGAAR